MDAVEALGITLAIRRRRRNSNINKRLWSQDWLMQRGDNGSYGQLFNNLISSEREEDFENHLRMPPSAFNSLLSKIEPLIARQNTTMRECISAGARLEATLIFLATGMSYAKLSLQATISRSALQKIIPETCDTIYSVLKEDYLRVSDTVGGHKYSYT